MEAAVNQVFAAVSFYDPKVLFSKSILWYNWTRKGRMKMRQEGDFFNKKGISGSTLKIIAMISMLVDHIAAVFIQGDINVWMRNFGRIAFPIYCFLLVEGFFHTHNIKKYAFRLGVFALLSEIPYDLAFSGELFDWSRQNVFFTLLISLLVIYCIERLTDKQWLVIPIIVGCILAYWGQTDYKYLGVLLVVSFYMFRENLLERIFSLILFNVFAGQIYGILSMPFLECYNGKRGLRLKYVFYVFYPVHLLILFFVGYYVNL